MNPKNGKIWRVAAIGMVLLLALVGVVYGYGRLSEKVDSHDKSIIKMQGDIEFIKAAVIRIETRVTLDDFNIDEQVDGILILNVPEAKD